MSYDPTKLKLYLEKKNDATNKELYSLCNATTKDQKGSIRKIKSRYLNKLENHETVETPKIKIPQANPKQPPQVEGLNTPPTDFIDDPDELLMSVATRELNKENPDPRWAGVLISVRKENIGVSKKEGNIRSQFKSMNIKDIAKILSRKPKDISLKPDIKESS
ncbi:hypothetical protein LCGC14_1264610 [marine sediment metagenome]|uniref:Uncharacterized protein n=1 Tax=marine sediment metagenome TaxID=412755 RepID=A0A0F9KZV7_9ZZZZ